MYGMIKEKPNTDWIKKRDLLPFTYPSRKEMLDNKIRSICLGSYIPWDTIAKSRIISEELGPSENNKSKTLRLGTNSLPKTCL